MQAQKDESLYYKLQQEHKGIQEAFLERIKTTGLCGALRYDDNSNFIYKWIVNRETIGKKALAELDSFTGDN